MVERKVYILEFWGIFMEIGIVEWDDFVGGIARRAALRVVEVRGDVVPIGEDNVNDYYGFAAEYDSGNRTFQYENRDVEKRLTIAHNERMKQEEDTNDFISEGLERVGVVIKGMDKRGRLSYEVNGRVLTVRRGR